MADRSSIEWTDATWNPVRSCSRVSPGCGGANHEGGCYAEKIAARFSDPDQPFHGFAIRTPHGGQWTGKLALVESALMLPLRWRRPRWIFINSMSDLFHENLPDEAIDKVFAVMALCPQHTFQALTKRADRMRRYCADPATPARVWRAAGELADILRALAANGAAWGGENPWPIRNVWLGVSVEDQTRADERIPLLLQTPAAVRFLSCEPLLGAVDLRSKLGDTQWIGGQRGHGGEHHGTGAPDCPRELHHHHDERCEPGIDWIIAGGESGPFARPPHPDWFRSLRDQCAAAGVPFFFKQWGEWSDLSGDPSRGLKTSSEDRIFTASGEVLGAGYRSGRRSEGMVDPDWRGKGAAWMGRTGKRAAGRILDGREHSEFPKGPQI